MASALQTGPPRQGLVLAVTCLALGAVVSAVASLNVAVPSVAADTHATQTQLSWVIDAYALVFAAVLLPAGALGDRYGRRRALVAGLVVFGAGSAVAMTVGDVEWLIGLRAVLGLGAALVMPATLSTITGTFPEEQRARAVGTWAAVAGGGAVVGLLAAGLLLEQWSWRSVFGLNVALAGVALAGTLLALPESADERARRIDATGTLLSMLGLGLLVFAIIEAPTTGWLAARTLGGLAAGLVVLAAFVGWELRAAAPILDPRLFTRPAFAVGTASIAVQFLAFFGFVFLVLQYLQLVRGERPLIAAGEILPIALGMVPSARVLAPRAAGRLGTGRVCSAGLVLVAAALAALSRLDADGTVWLVLVATFVLGLGMGLAMTPATSAVTAALPTDEQGVGSAVNDLARELGGALGIAVLGSVLQTVYRARLDLGPDVPAAVARQARTSIGKASQLGPQISSAARDAFVDGFGVALLCAAGIVLAAAAVTAALTAGGYLSTGRVSSAPHCDHEPV